VTNRKTSAGAGVNFFWFVNLRSQRVLISHIITCCYVWVGFTSKLYHVAKYIIKNMAFADINEDNISSLLRSKDSKSTQRSVAISIKLFKDYLL
jgi:hypothetical protein